MVGNHRKPWLQTEKTNGWAGTIPSMAMVILQTIDFWQWYLIFCFHLYLKQKSNELSKTMLLTCFRIANLKHNMGMSSVLIGSKVFRVMLCLTFYVFCYLSAIWHEFEFVANYAFFSVTIVNHCSPKLEKHWKTIVADGWSHQNHWWWWGEFFKNHRHSIVGKIIPSPFHRRQKLTIVPV